MVLALFGAGNMGKAIIAGLFREKLLTGSQLLVYDSVNERAAELAASYGASVLADPVLAKTAGIILLAVKPNDLPAALAPLAPLGQDQLLISIAAGVDLAALRRLAGPANALARVMPNLPAQYGFAASALCFEKTSLAQEKLVHDYFAVLGQVYQLPESAFAAFTGLAGSGPAYVMQIIEALADGAVRMGLERSLALALASQTVLGSAVFLQKSGLHPAQVKDLVSSPGGTTIEALAVLEEKGLRSALIEAVAAATKRAKQLGEDKFDE